MKKAAKVLGIELNAAPHSARKTYAVEVFKDKGLGAAQKELQHDRVSTTMLYAFSDMLSSNSTKNNKSVVNTTDLELFADLVAEKVVKKLEKNKNPA